MAADLYIHSAEGLTERDLNCFFGTTVESKYFGEPSCPWQADNECVHWKRVMSTESVWIGEVSWLKQAFLGDTYVPESVEAVRTIIGEDLPILDEQLRQRILEAIQRPNESAPQYNIADPSNVDLWLQRHMGDRLFTVSW